MTRMTKGSRPRRVAAVLGIAIAAEVAMQVPVVRRSLRAGTPQFDNHRFQLDQTATLARQAQASLEETERTLPGDSSHKNGTTLDEDDAFCAGCTWKDAGFNCGVRVKFLVEHYQISEQEAKASLLDDGRCRPPESPAAATGGPLLTRADDPGFRDQVNESHHLKTGTLTSTDLGIRAEAPREGKWPLLITGTPRSGTVATHSLLTRLGLDVSNDWCKNASKPYVHGFVSWIHVVEDAEYYGPCQLRQQALNLGSEARSKSANFGTIVHQTKDVLPSITSLISTEPLLRSERYARFIARHVNVNGTHTKEERGLRMWVEWQERVRRASHWRYKFEDLLDESKMRDIVGKLFEVADVRVPDSSTIHGIWSNWLEVKHNKRGHRQSFTWTDLMEVNTVDARRAQKLAKDYGYL